MIPSQISRHRAPIEPTIGIEVGVEILLEFMRRDRGQSRTQEDTPSFRRAHEYLPRIAQRFVQGRKGQPGSS